MPSIGTPCQIEPAQQLNDIAAYIIDTLSSAHCSANIIKDRLFGLGEAKTSSVEEPFNLDSRLCLIRAQAQELNAKLSEIQNRL